MRKGTRNKNQKIVFLRLSSAHTAECGVIHVLYVAEPPRWFNGFPRNVSRWLVPNWIPVYTVCTPCDRLFLRDTLPRFCVRCLTTVGCYVIFFLYIIPRVRTCGKRESESMQNPSKLGKVLNWYEAAIATKNKS